MMNYYEILGLNSGCTDEDVKNAYRKLSFIKHPDFNPESGHEDMVALNDAYSTLNTKEKRRVYDSKMGLGRENEFSSFRDYEKSVQISLRESITGCKKTIELEKEEFKKCDKCAGLGCEPNGFASICSSCDGKGTRVTLNKNENRVSVQMEKCSDCSGRGRVYSSVCIKCDGEGKFKDKLPFTVQLPAGVEDGSIASITIKDGPVRVMNVRIEIHITKDPVWTRIGNDLHIEISSLFLEAYVGFSFVTEDPLGERLELNFGPGSNNNDRCVIHGRGVKGGDVIASLNLQQMPVVNDQSMQLASELLEKQNDYRRARELPIGPATMRIRKK